MLEFIIEVEGMKCGMCESHVNNVVRRVKGVCKVKSSHTKNRTVVIAEDDANQEDMKQAIAAEGYGVGEISVAPHQKRGLFGRRK